MAKKNKFTPLTIDYIAKHVGEPIIIYKGQPDEWNNPESNELSQSTVIFLGDAITYSNTKSRIKRKIKNYYPNWFKTKKPMPKDGEWFYLNTAWTTDNTNPPPKTFIYYEFQVDSKNKSYVSPNLIDMHCYIKK